ncbi:MAG: cyclic lactone autoinducer peptide [Herbinix sp.]|nr:cyclic lactone autoinducer peptide [Herbinix sp.]
MKKVKDFLKKCQRTSFLTSLALVVVALSEVAADTCVIWILGQEDMPEELL